MDNFAPFETLEQVWVIKLGMKESCIICMKDSCRYRHASVAHERDSTAAACLRSQYSSRDGCWVKVGKACLEKTSLCPFYDLPLRHAPNRSILDDSIFHFACQRRDNKISAHSKVDCISQSYAVSRSATLGTRVSTAAFWNLVSGIPTMLPSVEKGTHTQQTLINFLVSYYELSLNAANEDNHIA